MNDAVIYPCRNNTVEVIGIREGFNDWRGRGCDDFVPGEVTKTVPSGDYMIPYMVGKLAANSSHLTRGVVKYVPGRGYFRAVPSQSEDKYVTSPPPQSLNFAVFIVI